MGRWRGEVRGRNFQGQVGDGSRGTRRKDPYPVKDLSDIASVHAGGLRTCALGKDGAVHCWGDLYGGVNSIPALVEGLPAMKQVEVSGGASIGTDRSGKVWWWDLPLQDGEGFQYNVGYAPQHMEVLSDVREVSPPCAIHNDDSVTCWGWSARALTSMNALPSLRKPVKIEALAGTRKLVAPCRVSTDGRVSCWVKEGTSATMKDIVGLEHVIDLAPGHLALTRDGTVYRFSLSESGLKKVLF